MIENRVLHRAAQKFSASAHARHDETGAVVEIGQLLDGEPGTRRPGRGTDRFPALYGQMIIS